MSTKNWKPWGQKNNRHTGQGKKFGLGQALWGHGSRHRAAQGRAGWLGGKFFGKPRR